MDDVAYYLECGAFVAGWLMSAYGHAIWKRVLVDKAHSDNPTPEKIGKGFYYIVPEGEYVRLQWWRAEAKKQDERRSRLAAQKED